MRIFLAAEEAATAEAAAAGAARTKATPAATTATASGITQVIRLKLQTYLARTVVQLRGDEYFQVSNLFAYLFGVHWASVVSLIWLILARLEKESRAANVTTMRVPHTQVPTRRRFD